MERTIASIRERSFSVGIMLPAFLIICRPPGSSPGSPPAGHIAELVHLIQPVVHGETPGEHLLGRGLGGVLVHLGLGALDQGEDVAHAEDARGHPLRLEGLQLGDLLPTPVKRMGLPIDSFMERAAPPRASPSSLVRMTPSTPTCWSNSRRR